MRYPKSAAESIIDIMSQILTICKAAQGRRSAVFVFILFFQCVAQTALPANAFAADNESRTELKTRLGQAQLASEQAFNRYYETLKNSPARDSRALGNEILGPAKSQTLKVLTAVHQKNQQAIFNKIYTSQGDVIDPADFRDTQSKIPPKVREQALKAQAGSRQIKAPSTPDPSYRSFSVTVPESGAERPAYTLDGSKVPAELNFPGKSDAPKKTRQLKK